MNKVNVGVVGCGNISSIYFENLTTVFKNINVYACADLFEENAKRASEKWGIAHIMTLEEMLLCPDISLILNITTPQSHYEISRRCLEAGKNVYVEKPLSLNFEDGLSLTKLAEEKGLYLGCAPDTFLGGGLQTCRKLIDDGFIGEPIGATAFMMCHGHESWHPSPEFYYKTGGGPMLDMGPYYVTALVNLMGSIKEISAMTSRSYDTRTITSEPKFGTKIDVEVETHVAGLMRFASGAIATIITSFDVWNHTMPRIEIYGTLGTLSVPDPNTFGGPVMLSTLDGTGFKDIPLSHIYAQNSRGLGLSDMANCILHGGENRASGKLACHVLEAMLAFEKSSKAVYTMQTHIERPAPFKMGIIKGFVDGN